ncbi:hypothetical protein [Erythrobacter crassostreae]|uniref:Lipoprotein n=1 Tax=Erythrobacter crassostreae TaxID=2828328 RepID=A0A9X1F4V9_9SPHN|nr:hypothetical protein [Erythrobacter crassostrea]MBV7259909.1 hypothetical protein [Erythrobacter crassostrea]
MIRNALLLSPVIMLAACSDEVDPDNTAGDATDLEVATTDGEAEAMAAKFPSLEFADLDLGAKIVGPQGPEVKQRLANEVGAFADITSYVACPSGMEECDPNTAPEGTIYTYVHIVFPGEDSDPSTGSGAGADSSFVESATGFRMTSPAHGFTGDAGYSKLEAIAAVNEAVDVIITCVDGGLSWTVNAGDGGNQWEQAEPLTFFWQSTLPPEGPAEAYMIEANDTFATGPGPYPKMKSGVTNACTASSTDGS